MGEHNKMFRYDATRGKIRAFTLLADFLSKSPITLDFAFLDASGKGKILLRSLFI